MHHNPNGNCSDNDRMTYRNFYGRQQAFTKADWATNESINLPLPMLWCLEDILFAYLEMYKQLINSTEFPKLRTPIKTNTM